MSTTLTNDGASVVERGGPSVRRLKAVWALLGTASVVVAVLQRLFVRYEIALSIVLLLVAILILATTALVRMAPRARAVIQALAVLILVADAAWLLTRWYPAWVLAHIAAMVLGFVAFGIVWTLRRRKVTLVSGAVRALGGVGVVVAFLLSMTAVVTAISPAPVTLLFQSSAGYGNSFEPVADSARTVVQDNTLLINDISYGTEYPNSYLDIYIADNDATVSRPTVISVHGGGWILGSKTMGDPNAGVGAFALSNGPVIAAGYNLVTIDYALAPEYEYPTPVIQLSQAVTFLTEHADEYGLDMTRVVLNGGSAGGQIAAQYAEVQTNPDLAAEMGIEPTLDPDHLKAITLDSAALDMTRAGRTEAPDMANDLQFGLAAQAYLGISGFLVDQHGRVDQANVIDHATSDFPPAFISDGNYGTFLDQAQEFSEKLTQLGVTNELNTYPLDEARLGHGFMGVTESEYVDDYNAKKIAFLEAVVD